MGDNVAMLTISRILHAGYVFECDGTTIAFDPIFENPFSRNCHAFPAVSFDLDAIRRISFDAVFISHFHDDHCSMESLDLLDRATPIYLYCQFDELFAMIRALGFTRVHALRTDCPVSVGTIEVIPREALDADVDSMFQIRAGGMNVLNVVDAWIAPVALALLEREGLWDMVLWPFQTMREVQVLSPSRAEPEPAEVPQEWLAQLNVLKPRYVVPSSCQFEQEPWSWYNHAFFPVTYALFRSEVERAVPSVQVVRLNPSVSVVLGKDGLTPAAPLAWVRPVGEQEVDYDYRPELVPPTTAEIASHFPALTAPQQSVVLSYCQHGLLEKYRTMELPEDSYFEQPRLWRLSVFDHAGQCTAFYFRVEGDTIAPAEQGAPGWTTEIAAAKLYAGLALGESLSSMYLRINDTEFDAATERDLEQADLVDDPLIRCLFNDAFGAYQAAQLRRLKTPLYNEAP
jgi:hypothetical protein